MEKVSLEEDIKKIVIQCINEPEIIQMIKERLECLEKSHNQQMQRIENSHNEDLAKKIELILEKQRLIEEYIKNKSELNDEELEEKLEYQKEKYDVIIEGLNKKYRAELEEKDMLLKKREEQCSSLEKEKNELMLNNANIMKDLEILKNKYMDCKEIMEIWNNINLLKDESKEYIKKLCGSVSIFSTMSLGRDENKTKQLWEYLRDLAVNNSDNREIHLLNTYFEFCINVYNSTKADSEKYDIIDIEIGSEFDREKYIRTSDSNQIGTVKAVLVKEVENKGNVKFKSIVKID